MSAQQGPSLREFLQDLIDEKAEKEKELRNLDGMIERARARLAKDIKPASLPGSDRDASTTEGAPKEGPYSGLGNEDAALKCLESASRPLKTAEVAKLLKDGGIESEAKRFQASVYSALKRLVEKGLADKVGEGRRSRWTGKGVVPKPWE